MELSNCKGSVVVLQTLDVEVPMSVCSEKSHGHRSQVGIGVSERGWDGVVVAGWDETALELDLLTSPVESGEVKGRDGVVATSLETVSKLDLLDSCSGSGGIDRPSEGTLSTMLRR
jgi:hypothetical protein